jgi:hypothetical protein
MFPSPCEKAEDTEPCSEDEASETNILFKVQSEWNTFLFVHMADATHSVSHTTHWFDVDEKTIGVQRSNPVFYTQKTVSTDE